jgi:hypothetical protein
MSECEIEKTDAKRLTASSDALVWSSVLLEAVVLYELLFKAFLDLRTVRTGWLVCVRHDGLFIVLLVVVEELMVI